MFNVYINVGVFLYQNPCLQCLQLFTSAIIIVGTMFGYIFMYFYVMKVIASLREQGKRDIPLLKMLSYNIVKYNVALNLKQCATLLYSMAVLKFPEKVCTYHIY